MRLVLGGLREVARPGLLRFSGCLIGNLCYIYGGTRIYFLVIGP